LYSLKQAPRLWQQFLAATLQELGFEPLDSDNYIYLNSTIKVIIITYVDDFLIIAKSIPAITKLKELLASKFSIKELGPVQYFVRVRIIRDRANKMIYLCQDAYIRKILDRFGITNSKTTPTPMATRYEVYLVPNIGVATKHNIKLYQSMLGSSNYASV
jgi:hypothetical protein